MESSKNLACAAERAAKYEGRANSCSVRSFSSPYLFTINTRVTSYLMNPYLFLPSLALSTSSLENAVFLSALAFACEGT